MSKQAQPPSAPENTAPENTAPETPESGESGNAAPQNTASGTSARKPKKPKKPQQVFTLLVELGRREGDGLPETATGAGLMCYASGVDEAEAVRETVAILKQAEMAPLDVTGYGTAEERRAQGHEIGADEAALMARALEENAVIVAQVEPYFD